MTTLPWPYFFGGLILSAIVTFYFARWTWIERVHPIARWWVNAYLSFLLMAAWAFVLAFTSFTVLGYNTFELMTADPDGGFVFYMVSGAEALGLAMVVLAASILMREVQSFRARKTKEDRRRPSRRRLDLLVGLVLLTSPIAVWAGVDARVQGVVYFLIAPCLVPLLAIALVWVAWWCWRNPTAKLHTHLGFQRLAAVSSVHGAFWFPVLFDEFAGRARNAIEGLGGLGGAALVASEISLATWLAVNVVGWVWEGFTKKDR